MYIFWQTEVLDENTHVTNQHNAQLKSHSTKFVGRKNLIKDCLKHLQEIHTGVLALVGKPGTGKSALLVRLTCLFRMLHLNFTKTKDCMIHSEVLDIQIFNK